MSNINLAYYEGELFSPYFADAGAAVPITIHVSGNLSTPGSGNVVTFEGGVLLSHESNLTAVDPTVYATASADYISGASITLQDQITINFQRGIDNFSVKLFNGLTTTANYLIRDDTGDSVTVTLGPNSSSNDAKIVQLLDTHGAKSVTIISLSSGPWDFSIDNIGFNFSTAETKIGENPVVASIADSTKDDFLLFSYLAEKATSKSASDLLAALQTVGLVDNDLLQLILSDPFDPNYKQVYAKICSTSYDPAGFDGNAANCK
jgi:hypothetical protein